MNNKYFHSYATGNIKLFKTNSLSDQVISGIQSIVTEFRLVILFRFELLLLTHLATKTYSILLARPMPIQFSKTTTAASCKDFFLPILSTK